MFIGFPVNQVIPVIPVSTVIPVIPVCQVIPVIPVSRESSESSKSSASMDRYLALSKNERSIMVNLKVF